MNLCLHKRHPIPLYPSFPSTLGTTATRQHGLIGIGQLALPSDMVAYGQWRAFIAGVTSFKTAQRLFVLNEDTMFDYHALSRRGLDHRVRGL